MPGAPGLKGEPGNCSEILALYFKIYFFSPAKLTGILGGRINKKILWSRRGLYG